VIVIRLEEMDRFADIMLVTRACIAMQRAMMKGREFPGKQDDFTGNLVRKTRLKPKKWVSMPMFDGEIEDDSEWIQYT
jgi:hypothetical protein